MILRPVLVLSGYWAITGHVAKCMAIETESTDHMVFSAWSRIYDDGTKVLCGVSLSVKSPLLKRQFHTVGETPSIVEVGGMDIPVMDNSGDRVNLIDLHHNRAVQTLCKHID